jgi:TPR repeat protein
MEHAASSPNSAYSGSVYSPHSAEYTNMHTQWPQQPPPPQQYNDHQHGRGQSIPTASYQQRNPSPGQSSSLATLEQPNFSPFPIIRNPPPNIPPTDEQKEASLEAARAAVLSCNDPDTQLLWAQDALSYIETCQQNEQRIALAQAPRSITPRIEHVLREDAVKVVSFLADQHHPKAEFMRGMWLEFGKFGHRIDKKEAFLAYNRASERGYSRADYRIGMQFESSNDALKAVKFYQQGVEKGDSASCYRLGMMTLLGQHGQLQDYEHGLNLIYMSAKTADENAPQGAYVFGMLQAHQMPQVTIPEHYLPRDIPGAKANIEKAAFLGFAKAQLKMGSAYELCELGCSFDPALSLHYNALAARQGEPEAELAISKWFLCGHEGLFEKNEEMAFTYAQRAALSGFATAQFALGYYYEVGIYVPVNFGEAKEWYRKASQGGNSDAEGRVDAISRSKTLSRKDHESIALSKIRQQRASMIGGPTGAPPMPAMPTLSEAEEPQMLDMPDPSRLSLNAQKPPARPGSAAPYPTGPPSMPNPEIRPTSAFGINPNLRASSAQSMGGGRQDPYGQSQAPYGGPQQRPYSNNDGRASAQGYGRGGRMPSDGHHQGTGGVPQIQPPSRPGTNPPYLNPQSSPPMRADIGFSAPLEPPRKPRTPQPSSPGMGQGAMNNTNNPPRTASRPNQPQGQNIGQQGRPNPTSNRPGPGPGPGAPASGYGSLPSQNPNNRTPSNQYPPQKVQAANLAPSKPVPNAPSGKVPQAKPNAMPAAAAPVRPPGKGPKTFDEMGVPQGKDKGECVSRPSTLCGKTSVTDFSRF